MTVFSRFPTLLISALCALGQSVAAQAPRPSDLIEASIRTGWKTDTGTHMAALHLRIADDWITYWRHPGETGVVPRLDWAASGNLADIKIHWPEPQLFIKSGFKSIGYSGELVLPIELTPEDPGAPIRLDAMLNIGVCDDICIPVDLALRSDLNGAGRHDQLITQALARRPASSQMVGLRDLRCDLTPAGRGVVLSVEMELPATGQNEFLLVELPGSGLRSRALPSTRNGSTITGQLKLRPADGQIPLIDRSTVQISLISERGTIRHQGCSVPN